MKRILWLISLAAGVTIQSAAQDPYPAADPVGTIVRAEYFIDSDPGFGNGTAIAITPGTDIANLNVTLAINGSGLASGIHYVFLRVMDNNGRWSLTNMRLFENFGLPAYPSQTSTAGVVAAEYFIDNDPGLGNGTPIALNGTTDESNISIAVPLTGINSSAHRLYIRTKDANGKWSLTNYAVFENSVAVPYPAATPAANIAQAEYYIDTDPGFGNGTLITIPASTDVNNFSVAVSLSGVSQGPHTIYLRSRQNPWSLSAYAEFLVGSTLPVQWLFVKGEVVQDGSRITWATGAEDNTAHFEIEYSKDGTVFSKAGEVSATGNPTGSSYSFRHLQPGSGATWYRIRQVDKDGEFTYSKTILLVIDAGNKMILFPNPATDAVHLSIPDNTHPLRLTILDARGRTVYSSAVNAGQSAVIIPVKSYAKGIYYVNIDQNGNRMVMKFIKQ